MIKIFLESECNSVQCWKWIIYSIAIYCRTSVDSLSADSEYMRYWKYIVHNVQCTILYILYCETAWSCSSRNILCYCVHSSFFCKCAYSTYSFLAYIESIKQIKTTNHMQIHNIVLVVNKHMINIHFVPVYFSSLLPPDFTAEQYKIKIALIW